LRGAPKGRDANSIRLLREFIDKLDQARTTARNLPSKPEMVRRIIENTMKKNDQSAVEMGRKNTPATAKWAEI
jgi:hypothetical protein